MGSKYKEGKRNTLKQKAAGEGGGHKFEFPSNVRQIGGINKGIKIYFEDYAYTYIETLGKKSGKEEMAVFLVGYSVNELGEQILVVSGAVKPPCLTQAKDGLPFSDDDWQYTREIISEYFEGLEIVGWARLQPGYGLYLSATDITSHYKDFSGRDSVLFLYDPEEKLDCFFAWNESQDDLAEVSGYFIYYDKNRQMNAYVSDMKKRKRSMRRVSDEAAAVELEAGEALLPGDDEGEEEAPSLPIAVERAKRLAESQRQKRIISMMTSVSALLFFACVIMGVGLLQNGERLSSMETQMRELRTGYNNIVSKLNDSVFPAFAAQSEKSAQVPEDLTEAPEESPPAVISQEPVQSAPPSLDEALGVAAVESAPPPDDDIDKGVLYVVQQGDTLTYISNKYYGNSANIGKIMEANGLTDPDKLVVGMELLIPNE